MKKVNGFDIPLRKLTKEEKEREITLERFKGFHYEVGEDFLDLTGEGNAYIFCGWLLHKYPEYSEQILSIANTRGRYLDIRSFLLLPFLQYDEEKDIDMIYEDFSEFCNQTEHLRKRVNQILIQVKEYYTD